ncbi:MAG: F0F1 ATP synthase subunit B [bacterium]
MEINITLVIQAVNFLIAFWLLKILYVSQLKPIFSARAEKIARDIEEAESLRSDALAQKAEYEAALHDARKEAGAILKQAVQYGEQTKAELLGKSKEEARLIVEKARAEARTEKERLYMEIKSHTAELAVAMASKILKESVDPETHQKMVQTFARKVGN